MASNKEYDYKYIMSSITSSSNTYWMPSINNWKAYNVAESQGFKELWKEPVSKHVILLEEKVLSCKTPHLNASIIHAPSLCTKCDEFPKLQEERYQSKYNFTGLYVEGKKTCPAEHYTKLEILELNPLNRIV